MLLLRIAVFILGLVSLFYSSICFSKPAFGIKIFQIWCRSINWKVEPVKYDVEIRNTKVLGFIGVLLGLALLYKAVF